MPILQDPSTKYRPVPLLNLPNRQWPLTSIEKRPRWLSTCLRDGNQAHVDPMDSEQKLTYFNLLVELGYKEIEVAFPSASDIDFNFVGRLFETSGTIPNETWIQVLSPCRPELIRRTDDSLKGAKKAILHLYLATSPCFQQICTNLARSLIRDDPSTADTEWAFEFSPDTFSDSNMDFVLEVWEAVKAAWEPSIQNPIIFNLPSTVEYFCTKISEREKICVSVHTHNDRGCACASAEMAQLAGVGQQHISRFLIRTGNADLGTLGLNLYTSGINPGIEFSDITKVIDIVGKTTKIPVHPRAPAWYETLPSGQLVVCAFSGFVARERSGAEHEDFWQIPYLPIDPVDIGRTYEAVIRVNSQSGKGGTAWIGLRHLNLDLPRGLQVAFFKTVQKQADVLSRELKRTEIILKIQTSIRALSVWITVLQRSDPAASPAPEQGGKTRSSKHLRRMFKGVICIAGHEHHCLGFVLDVTDYVEHAIGEGKEVKAATYIECTIDGGERKVWGAAIHEDVVQASLMAFLSAASS
ncbi:aldolase [Tothia fuscella]|uniref:2-isopropylmalate synthase n=1 Tax=Tothia fuscella TaxID=1048955 RepID=A0A9P4NUF2_9PEZI|nr:aldolase [Tothia fuscella]